MSNELINPYQTWRDDSGNAVANGTLTIFDNGTAVKKEEVYSDEALTTTQSNPYTLDAYGRSKGDIRFQGLVTVQLKDADGASIRTIDNVRSLEPPSSKVFYTSDYTSFSAAVTAAAGAELVVDSNNVIDGNITVSGLKLRFVEGGDLDPNTGVTVTLNCRITANKYQQIFTGAGDVTGAMLVDHIGLPVTWWGADTTGASASDAAFTDARTAARTTEIAVYVPATPTYYALANKYTMNTRGDKIIGDGWDKSIILMTGTESVIELASVERCLVEGLYLAGESGSSHGVSMVQDGGVGNNNINVFRDVYVGWVDGDGFHIESSISARFYNCCVDGNNGYRPGGLQAISGTLGSIKRNWNLYGITEASGTSTTNDNLFIGCNSNGAGDLQGLRVGDSTYQSETFRWIGGLLQGIGAENMATINSRYGCLKDVHIEPNPPETGTAQAGAASTITLATGANATDDNYNGNTITITSGTGSGQVRTISDYVGSTKVATVSASWDTNPDNTSVYRINDWAVEVTGASNFRLENLFVSGGVTVTGSSVNTSVVDIACAGIQIDSGCKGTKLDVIKYGIRSDDPGVGVIRDYSNKAVITNANVDNETGAIGDNTSGPRRVLFNGNMEHWVNATTIPCGFFEAGSTTVAQEATIKRTGSYSVKCTVTGSSDYLYIFLPAADNLREQWVTVETWVYNTSTDSLVNVRASINAGATLLTQGATLSSDAWERVRFTFYVPASANSIQIQWVPSTSGVYYVDDFIAWTGEGGYEHEQEVTLSTSATPSLMPTNEAFWPDTYICPTGTAITSFTEPMVGKPFTLYLTGARTLTQGANLKLNGSVNFVGASGDTMTLVYKADGVFYEVSRMVA